MKITYLLLLILMLFSQSLFSQEKVKPTPEEKAKKELSEIEEKINIDEAQKEKLLIVLIDNKIKKVELDALDDALKEKKKALKKEKKEALKKILTTEQYEKYKDSKGKKKKKK